MPGNFLNIDTEFPTLTGKESSKELIPELMNYLSLLVEQLRYTLNNLDTTNFNSKALSDWEADSTQDIVDQVVTLTALLNQTNQRLTNLTSRVTTAEGNITGLEGRMETAEGHITDQGTRLATAESNITNLAERTAALETWKTGAAEDLSTLRTGVNTNAAAIAALQTSLSGLGSDVQTLISEMAQLKGAINVDAAGNAVFGKSGRTTDIVGGTVRINGNPIT